MRRKTVLLSAITLLALLMMLSGCENAPDGGCAGSSDKGLVLYPENHLQHVNPDVRLRITFPSPPPLGNSGKISVYDAADDSLVDELDLSIPPGPKNNRTPSPYDTLTYNSIPDTMYTVNEPDLDPTHVYQQNYIGGQTEADAYHFYPVLINENTATIHLHNNHLEYNKTYYVEIDPEVFPVSDGGFAGISGRTDWTFTTKTAPPSANSKRWVVSTDGKGDFDTVQGAIDTIPDNNSTPKTIFVKNGIYEEMVYFRNKANFTLLGEDREKVVIQYANNGVFNPSSGHNRRTVFGLQSSSDVNLINFSIISLGEPPAQAEGLCIKGERLQVHNVDITGSGDALQAVGTIYLSRSSILGFGDNVLSYGALFFDGCELGSTYGPHLWPRNTEENHGLVFLNSRFYSVGDVLTDIARSPTSGNYSFPYAEAVLLNCTLEGIRPGGWGAFAEDTSNIHLWEYNSVDENGDPIDVSQRVAWSRQLTMENDAQLIADYSDPAYVLGGWLPELSPTILTDLPNKIMVAAGEDAELKVSVAAAPTAAYQWFKDGRILEGETGPILKLNALSISDSGKYNVVIKNSVEKVASNPARVVVKQQ